MSTRGTEPRNKHSITESVQRVIKLHDRIRDSILQLRLLLDPQKREWSNKLLRTATKYAQSLYLQTGDPAGDRAIEEARDAFDNSVKEFEDFLVTTRSLPLKATEDYHIVVKPVIAEFIKEAVHLEHLIDRGRV